MLEDSGPKEDLLKGALAGLIAAGISAAAWAAIALMTDRQFGFAAIAIGAFVGVAVRWAGHGRSIPAGILGAVCSLLAIAAGNILAVAVLVARDLGAPLTDVLAMLDFDIMWQVLTQDFSLLDGVFYAFALYEGFRFALVQTPKLAAPVPHTPVA